MSGRLPPRAATWLLRCFAPAADMDALFGDLAEEHDALARAAGRAQAGRWYWGQAVRSSAVFAAAGVCGAGWHRTWAVAAAVFGAATAAESGALWAVDDLLPQGGVEEAAHLLVGLVALALGGLLAERLQPTAPTALALIALAAAAWLTIRHFGTAPLWLQLGFTLLGPAACLAGGQIRPASGLEGSA